MEKSPVSTESPLAAAAELEAEAGALKYPLDADTGLAAACVGGGIAAGLPGLVGLLTPDRTTQIWCISVCAGALAAFAVVACARIPRVRKASQLECMAFAYRMAALVRASPDIANDAAFEVLQRLAGGRASPSRL
jgi:hypothetical protein